MTRLGWSMLTVLAVSGLWGTRADAVHRLEWDGPEVAWHRVCAFSHDHEADQTPHRFSVIHGSLQTLARADASLYAVYLDDPAGLERLEKTLQSYGGPADWVAEDLPTDSTEGLSVSWVPLHANGLLTLFVDEADQPGKEMVALVNGEGEILGTHELWTETAETPLLSHAFHSGSETDQTSSWGIRSTADRK